MHSIIVNSRKLSRILLFSAVLLVLNLLTLRYLAGEGELPPANGLAGRQIAIDPGHGGIDDGASGNGVVEKEINLAIGQKLAQELMRQGAVVTLTRDGDTDYYTKGKGGKRSDLKTRVSKINESGAEVFVSIHVNSIPGGSWSGAQVFYGGSHPASKALAECIQTELKDFPPGNKRQIKQDMGIIVLNATVIPGVLVETGFLSNKQEAARLREDAYQQKLAMSIAKGLVYHLNQNVAR